MEKNGVSVSELEIENVNTHHIFHLFQIKREISTMKLIRHPNVVQLHEVSCTAYSFTVTCKLRFQVHPSQSISVHVTGYG
jgi:hypothetical protein